MRRLTVPLLCWLLLLGLLPGGPGQPAPAAAGRRLCFAETGACAENAFLAFWSTHGATAILGLPVGHPLRDDTGRLVQFYERAVLEWHPDNAPAFRVQLARLGAERLGSRPEREAPPGPCAPPACRLLPETNHTIGGAFLAYWLANGGLPVFGLPLTEEFAEFNADTGAWHTVQYFERSRFELHAAPSGAPMIMLGRLGAEAWQARPDLHVRPTETVPDYPLPDVGTPIRLAVPALGIDAPIVSVGTEPDGTMAAPRRPFDIAWFAPGARPGQAGNAVVAGHVDFRGVGPAVFWRLRELTPGAAVLVTDDQGRQWRFVVQAVESYPADAAPVERIFGAADAANLNLITCVGTFDARSRSYDRRLVVYTTLDQ